MSAEPAFSSVMVVGGGAWGTALASLTARSGIKTILWAREESVVSSINSSHVNEPFLPGITLPGSLLATSDLGQASEKAALVFVVPAQFARTILAEMNQLIGMTSVPVALCSKGIERDTGKLMSQVINEVWPSAIPAVLSGPSFAADVANGLPTAVTLACENEVIGKQWLETIGCPHFRPYLSDDLVGAELGGAVKNVLAIACGIVEGKGLGESARAALMARGFAEFQRLGVALGAQPQTMAGLSGLGDLILTCSSRQSRNMSLGLEIGQGRLVSDVLRERKTVSEGAATAEPVMKLARANGVEMPICSAIADIVAESTDVDSAMQALLTRPLREE